VRTLIRPPVKAPPVAAPALAFLTAKVSFVPCQQLLANLFRYRFGRECTKITHVQFSFWIRIPDESLWTQLIRQTTGAIRRAD
jgi:hypothetical protein